MTDKDFTWYFHYYYIHNLGGDIISADRAEGHVHQLACHQGDAGGSST